MRALTPLRRMLAIVVVLAAAGAWGGPAGGAARPAGRAAAAEEPPNVLIFLTDDQRIGTMAVMPETLRRFRLGGVEYPEAAVTTPLCCPSRASIMTGRYAHNHGVVTNRDPEVLDQRSTLQRYLKDAGYLTALAGKFLNNWPLEIPPDYFDRWVVQNQGYERSKFNVDGIVRRVREYSTDFIAEAAVSYVRWFDRQSDAAPWFLYIAPFAPHGPFSPAERHRTARIPRWGGNPAFDESDRSDKPEWVQAQNVSRTRGVVQRQEQLRTLMSVDELVTAVMEEVRERGETSRTLAFYLSDNGFFWAEHGVGDKRLPYLQAVKVPFFARWPGRLPAGQVDGRLAANVDIMPTVLEAAGITPDPQYPVDGRSLLQPSERDHFLIEYMVDEASRVPAWASYLDRRRQYVEYYGEAGQLTFSEYYDLLDDPWQLTNLLGDADPDNDPPPTEIARLSAAIARERRCLGTEGPDACP